MSWYVYVLRCGDDSLYTGVTNDLRRRLSEHQAGRGGHYTRAHLPVRMVGTWRYGERGVALSAEAAFKRLRRSAKLRCLRSRQPFYAGPFDAQALREVVA